MKTGMTFGAPSRHSRSKRGSACALLGFFALAALAALAVSLNNALTLPPPGRWWGALWAPDNAEVAQLIFHYSLMPRLAVALLVGGGLGLAGVLFQQVLRNPLAEPSTLGVASGAQLGVTVATLWLLPGGETTRQLAALLLLRPMTLLGVDDGVARNLGLGLALARLLGARRLLHRLILAPLIGALLLWLTDQVVVWLAHVWAEVPTGAATALIGAPLLLWLLPRLRHSVQPATDGQMLQHQTPGRYQWVWLGAGAVLVLAGIAIGTAFTTLITLLLISGDPRLGGLLSWISGSTYGVGPRQAVFSAVTAFCLLLLVPLCRRWLTLLPMGSASALSLGVPLVRARLSILLLVAVLTAGATLTVGPLSFIGLMAPHMARMLGFHKPVAQGLMASAIGGILMMFADWCGRMVMFPNQIPAGLLATFIGAPYFIWLLRRQGR